MEYLSKQRYDEIAAELKHLINEVYPKVKDDLAEARAQGDLSENAGYREARRIQAKTISRIRFLQKVLEHSRVINPAPENRKHYVLNAASLPFHEALGADEAEGLFDELVRFRAGLAFVQVAFIIVYGILVILLLFIAVGYGRQG